VAAPHECKLPGFFWRYWHRVHYGSVIKCHDPCNFYYQWKRAGHAFLGGYWSSDYPPVDCNEEYARIMKEG